MSNDILFDFATDYRLSHDSITDAETFGLSDAEYADFVPTNAQDFEYNTETEALAQLEKWPIVNGTKKARRHSLRRCVRALPCANPMTWRNSSLRSASA